MPTSKSKPPRQTGPAGGRSLTQRMASINRWREQFNPLRALTLARAVSLAEAYYRGEMADYQWTCFFVEQTDPDLFALLEMRLGRILEMEYDFVPEKGADERAAEAQRKLLTEKFSAIDNFNEAIEHLALAPFRHYAHLEKWYEGGALVHLEPVDQWNVVRAGLRGPWRYNPEARSTTYAALGPAADLPPEQFIFREVRRGINRIALFKFVRSSLSDKDWDAFVEIFGFLGGVVIGPPDLQRDQASEFSTAAERVAEGGSGFLPYGSDYKVNPTAKGAHPFKERLDHLSEKLVLVGTGGKLTMLTEAGSGTLAGGAHAEIFDQIAAAEARRIGEIINTQLLPELLGDQAPLVYFRLAANAETDAGAAVDQVQKLSVAGYRVDPAEVAERTGWTVELKPLPESAPQLFGQTPGGQRAATVPAPAVRNRTEQRTEKGGGFRAAALKKLSEAQAKTLQPLVDRLNAILALPDDKIDAALARLSADLVNIRGDILRDPAVAAVFEEILGTALVDGAAAAAGTRAAAAPAVIIHNRLPASVPLAPAEVKLDITLHQTAQPDKKLVSVKNPDGSHSHYRTENIP